MKRFSNTPAPTHPQAISGERFRSNGQARPGGKRAASRVAAAASPIRAHPFIGKVVSRTVTKPGANKEHERSRRIDRILTGKYTAIPACILIMVLVFWLTFNAIGLSGRSIVPIHLATLCPFPRLSDTLSPHDPLTARNRARIMAHCVRE